MMNVTVTGADEVERALRALADKVPTRVAAALRAEAEIVMTNSKENYVPVATGALRASGIVLDPVINSHLFGSNDISVMMGYGGAAAPYALAVHENPRAGKTGGVSPSGRRYKRWSRIGQWKYLEQPFLARVSGFAARVKARVLEGMG